MNEERAVKGIVIDAGHGGDDPGAVANGYQEKNFNLEAAQYMYRRFQELGAPVTLIRQSDETISPNERVQRILAAYGDDPNVIVISNHINSGGGEGAEVIYALRNTDTLARQVLESIGQAGQIMRKYYQRRLPENPSKDYYFIHRDTGSTQPLIVEYGFIDNTNDVQKLQNNLLDYVEAVVRAVANYAGIRYTPPEGSQVEYYTVQPNDSLWYLANQWGTTVAAIKQLNNLTSDSLQVGQVLRIPTTTPTPPPSDDMDEYTSYTVKRNDSLFKIAQQFGVSVQSIIDLNNLTTTNLDIGQVLLIPNKNNNDNSNQPSQGRYYTVELDDSLWTIARRFNTTVDAIKRANNLTSNDLQVGQRLWIPTENDETPEENPSQITYTVQSGDSLWNIARRYNVTVDQLKTFNNLTSNMLQIGQVLRIPSTDESAPNYRIYTVQRDDSLWSIARQFDTTINTLRTLNNLTTDVLDIGQQLKIPA